jgi:hypothetical protein
MLGRRLRRRTRVGAIVLAAPILVVGTAYLAANVVAPSYAGVTHVHVAIPSTVTVVRATDDAKLNVAQADSTGDYYHFINVRATLTRSDGTPVQGALIVFTADTTGAGGQPICQDVTDGSGTASCASDTKLPTSNFSAQPTSFVASFAGNAGLAASSDIGGLTVVGDAG